MDTGICPHGSPLYLLLKDSQEFAWGKDQQQAFDSIKKALLSAPALTLPDIDKPFVLYVEEKGGLLKVY